MAHLNGKKQVSISLTHGTLARLRSQACSPVEPMSKIIVRLVLERLEQLDALELKSQEITDK